ncbi:MAG: polysaccharide deacetylase family protein [Acidobacteriaceae bacterium]|nr:polysaccharide deacetylase family protein [Acidobacteriaceae bacterium]
MGLLSRCFVALWMVCAVGAGTAQQPLRVAFTFDDLPAHGPLPPGVQRPEVIASILATLHQEEMPPVYGFVNGFRMETFPYQIHILEAWQRAGEPVGNHTWSHPELDKLTARQYIANIERNEPVLRALEPRGGWRWFRYPFLEEGDTVAKREAVREWLFAHHYRVAEISLDFQDYNWNDTYARCAAKRDDAAIGRLHDSYLHAASEATISFRALAHLLYGKDVPYILLLHVGAFDARMLPELIAQFRSEGFGFTTLEEASADPVYAFDPKQPTAGGSTFLEQVAAARNVRVPELPDYSTELNRICR